MVRNPLERQISSWKMQYAFGKENAQPWRVEEQWALKGFEFWMAKQKTVQQWHEVQYYYQIESYLKWFPETQVLISYLEDWRSSEFAEITKILSFLNVDVGKLAKNKRIDYNIGNNRTIESEFSKFLKKYGLIKPLKRVIPEKIGGYLIKKVLRKRVRIPAPAIREELLEEFKSMTYSDNIKLHRYCGKPDNFWN